MSIGREFETEMKIEKEITLRQHIDRLSNGLWTMEDGTIISVQDMELQHIINCINMLRGRDDDLAMMWLKRLREELDERTESITITINVVMCSTPEKIEFTLEESPDPFPSSQEVGQK